MSNNAARIRLWLNMKQSMQNEIDTIKITYADLQSKEYALINPLKKVPVFIRSDGSTIFESNVILSYLEDKYGGRQTFTPSTPEGRQDMNLFYAGFMTYTLLVRIVPLLDLVIVKVQCI